ncbi:hypothetical protein [Methylobacterium sp. Leaf85]|uniref:hypothetical protein n=1 Tax=Methylobacterium sp. Leaf85 TaxID=1736241 RepID=UPI0012E6F4E8|nr:hypothetical protein [Methylobacterium sp. Leaf85]
MNGDLVLPDIDEEKDEGDSLEVASANAKKVTISMQYWHSGSECISEWQRPELKKLAKLINKVQGFTEASLKADPGLGWKLHSGPAKGGGFSRPTYLSKDIELSELRVDGKSRVHGALIDDIFFLVWLDRGHAVFPQKKQ